jgi:hypothetical protein
VRPAGSGLRTGPTRTRSLLVRVTHDDQWLGPLRSGRTIRCPGAHRDSLGRRRDDRLWWPDSTSESGQRHRQRGRMLRAAAPRTRDATDAQHHSPDAAPRRGCGVCGGAKVSTSMKRPSDPRTAAGLDAGIRHRVPPHLRQRGPDVHH